jgi:hypothetical protein
VEATNKRPPADSPGAFSPEGSGGDSPPHGPQEEKKGCGDQWVGGVVWQEEDRGQEEQPQPQEDCPRFFFRTRWMTIAATIRSRIRPIRMVARFSVKKASMVNLPFQG